MTSVVGVAVATMRAAPSDVDSEVVTQLVYGEPVVVDEERDGWVRAVALDQPAEDLDPRGYPGWLREADLISTTDAPLRTYSLGFGDGTLRDAPRGAVVVADLAPGTRLAAVGPARDGWLPVHAPGGPLWTHGAAPSAGPVDVLEFARRYAGTTYVWGGMTPGGIDCSGLVHMTWRRFGVTVPRDAHAQAAASVPVPLGEERPGDLYFFARPGRPVHHVGFVAGPSRMVHACYAQGVVVEEPLRGERLATLVSVHRVAV